MRRLLDIRLVRGDVDIDESCLPNAINRQRSTADAGWLSLFGPNAVIGLIFRNRAGGIKEKKKEKVGLAD